MKMKNNKFYWSLVVSGVIIIGLCVLAYYREDKLTKKYNELSDNYNNYIQMVSNFPETCEIYNGYEKRNILEPRADGLYWNGKDYYCVWAKDRTLEQQELADRHEYAHYLIDNDYNHFCEGVNKK